MRFRHGALAALGIAILFGATSAARGQFRATAKQVTVDNRARDYFEFAPRSAKQSSPLVLVLHGGGGNGRQMERSSGFNALARKNGFVVCYPEAVEKNWNDGRDVEFIVSQKEKIDDVKFLKTMVAKVAEEHSIDLSRVYVVGISNGAFMSHRLAAEASDVFAAVAPIVGGMALPVAEKFAPSHPISVFVIQGTADPLVPYDGGEVGYKNSRRKRGELAPTPSTIDRYVAANQIDGKPQVRDLPDRDTEDGTTTKAFVYPPGRGGAKVQLYRVENGGHTWPGTRLYAPESMIGKVSQDFNATEEIWSFFVSCPPRKTSP